MKYLINFVGKKKVSMESLFLKDNSRVIAFEREKSSRVIVFEREQPSIVIVKKTETYRITARRFQNKLINF